MPRGAKHFLTVLGSLVFFWGFCFEAAAAQGLKIGFVKDERIFQEYPAWQRAQKQWELEKKAWDEEAAAKQQELLDLEAEYEKQKLILSEEKKREREAILNAKREALDAYTSQVFGPGGTAEKKYEQLVKPILESVHKAIETVALEGNYDVIFTLQGLGYIKESYDVTDKVLKALEELEE
ncbi:MAG: OmpH family outer membrane protein [Candidatus Zixiibacteriota bacterium]